MTCTEIETIVARHWGIRAHIIVPNVSWGLGIHECDMLIVSKAGYCTEVEIKVSKADLKKDQTKRHGHNSDKVRYLFFAIPESLAPHIDLIPARAGVIVIKTIERPNGVPYSFAEIMRQCEINPKARKLTDQELRKLGHLGCMRIWPLKERIVGMRNDIKALRLKSTPTT